MGCLADVFSIEKSMENAGVSAFLGKKKLIFFFFFFFQLKENLSGEMGLQIVRFLVLYLLCSYL